MEIVTAIFIGLKRRGTILTTRREINTNRGEPLMAIIPSQALAELWSVTAIAERALLAVSLFVIAVGIVSILTSILTSLNERRREMAILRSVGARPWMIFALLMSEAALLALAELALLGLSGSGILPLTTPQPSCFGPVALRPSLTGGLPFRQFAASQVVVRQKYA